MGNSEFWLSLIIGILWLSGGIALLIVSKKMKNKPQQPKKKPEEMFGENEVPNNTIKADDINPTLYGRVVDVQEDVSRGIQGENLGSRYIITVEYAKNDEVKINTIFSTFRYDLSSVVKFKESGGLLGGGYISSQAPNQIPEFITNIKPYQLLKAGGIAVIFIACTVLCFAIPNGGQFAPLCPIAAIVYLVYKAKQAIKKHNDEFSRYEFIKTEGKIVDVIRKSDENIIYYYPLIEYYVDGERITKPYHKTSGHPQDFQIGAILPIYINTKTKKMMTQEEYSKIRPQNW